MYTDNESTHDIWMLNLLSNIVDLSDFVKSPVTNELLLHHSSYCSIYPARFYSVVKTSFNYRLVQIKHFWNCCVT